MLCVQPTSVPGSSVGPSDEPVEFPAAPSALMGPVHRWCLMCYWRMGTPFLFFALGPGGDRSHVAPSIPSSVAQVQLNFKDVSFK